MMALRCSDLQDHLSGYLDGELAPLERAGLEGHLATCGACRRELAELTALSRRLREEGRRVPPPPSWDRLASRIGRPRRLSPFFAAGVAAVLLAAFALAVRLGSPPAAPGPVAPRSSELRGAGLPGLEGFLAAQNARPVPPGELRSELGFRPRVPRELPGGFRLERAFVLSDRCCAGSCLVYRRGDDVASLIQYPAHHPLAWRTGRLASRELEGMSCRWGRGPGVEVLQVEPRGLNLTLVARPGAMAPEAFVAFLKEQG